MRRLPREHLVEHRRERVDVRPRRDLLLGRRLFRAHVVRRAEAHPGLGHPPAGRGGDGERDAEVHDHRASVVQQQILRLDVAMDDAVAMRVVERIGDLAGDAHGFVDAELRLARELLADGLALDEGHDVVQEPVSLARVEEREDVRVAQGGGGLDLDDEAFGAEDGGEFGFEDLDRDLAIVLQVLGEIDGRHAALAELAEDAVAVGEGEDQCHRAEREVMVRAVRGTPRRRDPACVRSRACSE